MLTWWLPGCKLFMDLGLESPQSRRNSHKLLKFYKNLHGIAPNYLSELIPPLILETISYSLRSSDNIRNYRALTNLFLNSFFPSTTRAWNDHPSDMKSAPSAASFKHGIKQDIKEPPEYYNDGTFKHGIKQDIKEPPEYYNDGTFKHGIKQDIKEPPEYYNDGTFKHGIKQDIKAPPEYYNDGTFKHGIKQDIKEPPEYYNDGTFKHGIKQDIKEPPEYFNDGTFKHGIKQDIKEPSKHYNVCTRKGQVLYA